MAKSILEAFNEDFLREIKQARNYPEAYDKATEKFEEKHGFTVPFSSYDSFRVQKAKKKRR